MMTAKLICDLNRTAPYEIAEFKALLQIRKSTRRLQQMCEEKKIECVKLGSTYYIPAKVAHEFAIKLGIPCKERN